MSQNFFFSSPLKRARLLTSAQAWLGTPFVKGANLCGAGVDCIHLAAEIYRECGVFESYQFPRYTLDGGKHLTKSLVLEWLEKRGRFEKTDGICAGDLLVFQIGRQVEHHVGIAIDAEQYIHVLERRTVTLALISDSNSKNRLTGVYRPLEVAV